MKSSQSTQDTIKIEIHYRVFSMTFVCHTVLQEKKTTSQVVEDFIEVIRKTTSNTAYILYIKKDEMVVYTSAAQKRENQLWQQQRNQKQLA